MNMSKSRTMTGLVCILALSGGCTAVDEGPQAAVKALATAPVWHSSMNGRGANLFFFDGPTEVMVDAWEYGTGQSRIASLFFQIVGGDPASLVCTTIDDPWWGPYEHCYYATYIIEWGFGTIPSDDFTASPTASSARLHTTTGADVFIQKCTYAYPDYSPNCTSVTTESFDLAWNTDSDRSYSQDGTSQYTSGAFVFRSAGAMTNRSAQANGTAAGYVTAGGLGYISSTVGATISREVFKVEH